MASLTFSRAFKAETVRLVTDLGAPIAQAVREVEVAESAMRR